jgi:pyridoxal phosphate enzyme (YggS family)
MTELRAPVAQRLAAVRSRIEAACTAVRRDPRDVTIVAVTKGFGPQAVEAALHAGLADIGENYYQEAAAKFARIAWVAGARKHFIGRLQRNKAAKIARMFDVVQTVDDLETAALLDRAAAERDAVLDVLVQVNVAADDRQGVAPEQLAQFARSLAARPHLRVRGLMAMGPASQQSTARAFERAQQCFVQLRDALGGADILSMGMSDDLESALAHGATMLRIGSALFGPRPALR